MTISISKSLVTWYIDSKRSTNFVEIRESNKQHINKQDFVVAQMTIWPQYKEDENLISKCWFTTHGDANVSLFWIV